MALVVVLKPINFQQKRIFRSLPRWKECTRAVNARNHAEDQTEENPLLPSNIIWQSVWINTAKSAIQICRLSWDQEWNFNFVVWKISTHTFYLIQYLGIYHLFLLKCIRWKKKFKLIGPVLLSLAKRLRRWIVFTEYSQKIIQIRCQVTRHKAIVVLKTDNKPPRRLSHSCSESNVSKFIMNKIIYLLLQKIFNLIKRLRK